MPWTNTTPIDRGAASSSLVDVPLSGRPAIERAILTTDDRLGMAGVYRAAWPGYHAGMYLDALEFLEEEREAWAPYEALDALTDEQLSTPVAAAHGWSGRQLMGHLIAWQEVALAVATELAVNETSPRKVQADADWETRGGDVVNAEVDATMAALPMEALRDRFRTLPGQLRGYLTVVPETRWLKNADFQRFFYEETTEHYEEHRPDLEAVLEASRG
jgi:hypothetical protein